MDYKKLTKNEYGVPIPIEKTAVLVINSVESERVIRYARNGSENYTLSYFPRCINLLDGCHAQEDYYTDREFKIILFKEFLDLETKIEIVSKAVKDYPIGTKVKNAIAAFSDNLYTITTDNFRWGNTNNLFVDCEENTDGVCLWKDGKFAEIVKKEAIDKLKQEQDKVLAHIKSYLPDFTSILRMSDTLYTCAIDPLNTYGANYYFKSLKAASQVKEGKITKMDKSEAKKKSDALMGCLPEYQIPPAKKLKKAEESLKKECPETLRGFNVGDVVSYMGETTIVAAKRYSNNQYVVEYSKGWQASNRELVDEGKLIQNEKYHYTSAFDLKSVPSTSKQDPSQLSKSTTPDFKVGDWVVITKSGERWCYSMDKFIGRCVQITELHPYTRIRFSGDDGWFWDYKFKHFRKATSQEIAHELSKLSPGINSTTIQLDGFRVGDRVKVIKGGGGLSFYDEGKYVTITELGVGKYSEHNAARIAENLGNQINGAYDRWIGLYSFEVPTVGTQNGYKHIDVIWEQSPPRDSWKEPKSSDIIALKEEPHTITTSLAEPLVLQIKKKSIKIVTV